jgi:hypothetical protein
MATKKKKSTRKATAKRNKPKTKAKPKSRAKAKAKPRANARVAGKSNTVKRNKSIQGKSSPHTDSAFLAPGYTHAWQRENYETLKAFWPFYLHEHSRATNRRLHFVGSTLGLALAAVAIGTNTYPLLIAALVSGYAFAWFGHFFIEKNRPATFKYPLKSFISDWRMWYSMLTGKIGGELRKYGIQSR